MSKSKPLRFFEFTAKGKTWCRRKGLDDMENLKFVLDPTHEPKYSPRLLHTIPFEIKAQTIVLSAGGSIYGDSYAAFAGSDSFYTEIEQPAEWGGRFCVDELAAHPNTDVNYKQHLLNLASSTALEIYTESKKKFMRV